MKSSLTKIEELEIEHAMKMNEQLKLDMDAYHSVYDLFKILRRFKITRPFLGPSPAVAQGFMVKYRKKL